MPTGGMAGTQRAASLFQGLAFPILIVASVVVILLPLPPLFMDLFLSCNITAAVLILLTTIYVGRPLEFSVFPALLLGTTLFRLVLNLASTRLILTRGASEKTAAAGHVIEAFGEFVAGDKLVVGLILFCILVVIQFLVITKGAGRISEVAARFFLDGMPGKQMAIDGELASGAIKPEEARRRREEVTAQADFYGAMEGASKFVRGDAIAGIVIMLINVMGGLYVGVIESNMGLRDAAEVFTKLTIGDGLVTQVPAFLISLASGLIVTRTSADSDLPSDVVSQLFRHPMAMFLSAGFLLFLTITGLPKLPLMGLAGCCITVGVLLQRRPEKPLEPEEVQAPIDPVAEAEKQALDRLHIEPIMLQVGAGLVVLVDPNNENDLLASIRTIRINMAEEIGMLLPNVRVRDNTWLEPTEYSFSVRDTEVARGLAWPGQVLAIATANSKGELPPGLEVKDPINGLPAKWIPKHQAERARMKGYQIIEPIEVILLHLQEVIRRHSEELLTRQQVHDLIEQLKEIAPKLVAEVSPDKVKMSHIHAVLRNLLVERLPIRDLETILQTIVDNVDRVQNLALLTEYVRTAMSRTICQKFRGSDRYLHVISLDPVLEDFLRAKLDFDQIGIGIASKLSPQESEAILSALTKELKKLIDTGMPPIVLTTTPQIRAGLRQMTSRVMPSLAVLSLNEITMDTQIASSGYVSAECLRPVLTAATVA